MKKLILFLAIASLLSSGCLKNTVKKSYTLYYPIYKTRQEVRDAISTQSPQTMSNLGSFAIYNSFIFVNELEKGVHIVNRNEAGVPTIVGFIPIPGNRGIAIRNNMLYADCYSDLFVININDIQHAKLQTVRENTFMARWNPHGMNDSNKVVVEWQKKDTTVTQEYVDINNGGSFLDADFMTGTASSQSNGSNSQSSSMATFTLVNEYLYAVDRSNLYSFNVANASDPILTKNTYINWNVETIFPFKDKLFLGTRTGMYMFSLSDPASPTYLSVFSHANVCDPVIADEQYAFVTLRSGTTCNGFTNQLDVLDISNPTSPIHKSTYPFTNPHGLSKDQNILFICDGQDGLKLLDASNPLDIKQKEILKIGKAIDVMASGGNGIVITENSIIFFTYSANYKITQTGSLSIVK